MLLPNTRVALFALIVVVSAVRCYAEEKSAADGEAPKDKRPRAFHTPDKRLGGRFFSTRVVEKRPGARPFFGDAGGYWQADYKRGGARYFYAPDDYSSSRAKRPGARAFYSPASDLSGYYDMPSFRRSGDSFWSFRKKRLGGRAFYSPTGDDGGYGGWIKKAAADDYWF